MGAGCIASGAAAVKAAMEKELHSRGLENRVTLTGTGFTGTTAVAFNGTPAAAFTVQSDSALQATAPAGVTSGPISVTTPGGSVTSLTSFTVLPGWSVRRKVWSAGFTKYKV